MYLNSFLGEFIVDYPCFASMHFIECEACIEHLFSLVEGVEESDIPKHRLRLKRAMECVRTGERQSGFIVEDGDILPFATDVDEFTAIYNEMIALHPELDPVNFGLKGVNPYYLYAITWGLVTNANWTALENPGYGERTLDYDLSVWNRSVKLCDFQEMAESIVKLIRLEEKQGDEAIVFIRSLVLWLSAVLKWYPKIMIGWDATVSEGRVGFKTGFHDDDKDDPYRYWKADNPVNLRIRVTPDGFKPVFEEMIQAHPELAFANFDIETEAPFQMCSGGFEFGFFIDRWRKKDSSEETIILCDDGLYIGDEHYSVERMDRFFHLAEPFPGKDHMVKASSMFRWFVEASERFPRLIRGFRAEPTEGGIALHHDPASFPNDDLFVHWRVAT